MSRKFREFAESLKIKLLNLPLYYAHANGQAEASNKTLINLIKKKVEEKPRRWHEVLTEALWAYQVSKHGAIKVTPFELVYGQEAMLPIEVNLQANIVMLQETLSSTEYISLMMDEIDDHPESLLRALREIEKEKLKVARAYNKRVKEKSFQVGDMVWKTILPLGSRSNKFGKWSPEGPYVVVRIVPGNAYFVETLEGQTLPKALNGKYLKICHTSIWQGT
jgi:hypothetical protein